MQDLSIQQFESEQFGTIRTTTIDGEPWFVASDIAKALGYRDAERLTRRLDEDEKDTRSVGTLGGNQKMTVINEPGLYNAILGSKIEGAKAFKRWVTHEVLPSIRKYGAYITPQTMADMMADPRNIAKVFNALADEQQKVQALTEDNARMLPKAMAYDAIIDTDGTSTVTEVARYLAQMDKRMTVKRLFALLRSDHLICKCDRAPTKLAIKRGLAKQIMTVRKDGTRNEPYARLTTKGIDYCIEHYIASPVQMQAI